MTYDSAPFAYDTSGITDYTLLLSELVKEAFVLCQMASEGEELTSEMLSTGVTAANLMFKTLQTKGLILNSYAEGVLFVAGGQRDYVLANEKATNEYWHRPLSVAAVATDTTLTFSSVEDATAGDVVGVLKDDNEYFWTTIASVTATTIILDDALDGSAAIGSQVVNYTNSLKAVSRLTESGVRRRDSFINDVPILLQSRESYMDQPSKFSVGQVSLAYYDRQRSGELMLWPTPADGKAIILFTYERKIEGMFNLTDHLDFDAFWLEALVTNLAYRLAQRYRVPPVVMADLKESAALRLNEALSYDNDVTDINIYPGMH